MPTKQTKKTKIIKKVVRTRYNPIKDMLRWLYYLLIAAIVFTVFYVGWEAFITVYDANRQR